MQENTFHTPRRWERETASIPVKLVLKAERFKADNSAVTIDVSLRGMKVRTNLTLIPGEWVGVVPKGEFPHAMPARVVWAREDEFSHWIFAGLEFMQASES
jgi:hypothetical protein